MPQPHHASNASDDPIFDSWDKMDSEIYREIGPPSFIQQQQHIRTVERPHQEFNQQQQDISRDYASEPSSPSAILPDGGYPLQSPHRNIIMMDPVNPDGRL